ncbi:hypothetical protein [Paenibacillus agri]|uniref:Uncharacterized protein n=1 Tax=Paenibacillus agri TaxID=2744309 RepID=A0A850EP80_9BACL|nr:hypothetical protein [Paenibacillus agri]NUU61114.1 hypothetical protein [Paenibacillus agri]
MDTVDYLAQYDQEGYVFNLVQKRFVSQGFLNAYDFFCIIIWKANRAKSKIAQRLTKNSQFDNLEDAVKELTDKIYKAPDNNKKLRLLIVDWGFQLPMASAILTALYPNDFTVYDIRVCDELNEFHGLKHIINFENIWTGYQAYKQKVELIGPSGLSLRDKDRYIWSRSFSKQLEEDLKNCFGKGEEGV